MRYAWPITRVDETNLDYRSLNRQSLQGHTYAHDLYVRKAHNKFPIIKYVWKRQGPSSKHSDEHSDHLSEVLWQHKLQYPMKDCVKS